MRAAAAVVALLLALPARADILLDGHQHVGNSDTTSTAGAAFVPPSYVTRNLMRANPSYFNLSQAATITGITLSDPIGINAQHVEIDGTSVGLNFCAACAVCTGNAVCAASITIGFITPVALSPGTHTLDIDGVNTTRDIGWSAVTLVSTATTTSRMLNQRRHVGDNNDSADEYDISSATNNWYPDRFEGGSLTQSFSIDAARRLVSVRFRRLRDVDIATDSVAIDGTFIGNLANTGSPREADPTTITTSLLLAAGTHTITVTAGNVSATNLDDFSWDDIVLLFSDPSTSGTPGFFNAVDPGADFLTGAITTKIAGGSALSLDLYALNAFGTGVDATYTGTATITLLDASNNSGPFDSQGCRSTWTVVQALGSAAFTAGKATFTPAFPDAGLREARLKITDTASTATGCSIDNFAVRPSGFGSISVMHASETSAGVVELLDNTGTTGLPRHKAGQPFTILATAVAAGGAAATNYDGTPTLAGHALAPATADGATTVTSWISLGGGSLQTDNAKYYEAGPATLELSDATYANIDAGDSTLAQRTIGPTYVNVGRFIPDHFTLAPESATPSLAFLTACGSFTYAGQPFTLTPSPFDASITAVAANGGTTANYGVAALYGLPAGNLATDTTFPALTGTVASAGGPSPDHALTNLGNGVTRYRLLASQFAFARNAPGAPFDAEIAMQPGPLNEADGVDFSPSPGQIGAPTAGNGIDFTGTGTDPKEIRFGRLVVDNANGSERLPLSVPLRAEYWYEPTPGNGGFVTNLADNCTALASAQVVLAGALAGNTSVTSVTALSQGAGTVTLAAPNLTGTVSVTAAILSAFPWLLTDDADADVLYNNPPAGLASFGLYNDGDTRIYQREVVQ